MLEKSYHFFATTAFGWGIGDTRAEAIEKAARMTGQSIIKEQVKSQDGVYCWSCRVNLPRSARFTINEFKPDRLFNEDGQPGDIKVPFDVPVEAKIQNIKGHLVLFSRGSDHA